MLWTLIRMVLELIATLVILCVEAVVIGFIILLVGLLLLGRVQ